MYDFLTSLLSTSYPHSSLIRYPKARNTLSKDKKEAARPPRSFPVDVVPGSNHDIYNAGKSSIGTFRIIPLTYTKYLDSILFSIFIHTPSPYGENALRTSGAAIINHGVYLSGTFIILCSRSENSTRAYL